ncbi:MAG TPA: hypothetical protein PKJ83_09820 [Cyclobacteriaceae bacterium]|nr:hypothetical protein [Cyclobacteriaceae bacterium]
MVIRLAVLISTLIFYISCGGHKQTVYPFTFINSKTENSGGGTNRMDLYVSESKLEIDSLKILCKEQKSDWDGSFYFLVVFDDKQYATYPNNQFTALYNDEARMKHIIAVYQYNKINAYSELFYYPINMFESPPVKIGI